MEKKKQMSILPNMEMIQNHVHTDNVQHLPAISTEASATMAAPPTPHGCASITSQGKSPVKARVKSNVTWLAPMDNN